MAYRADNRCGTGTEALLQSTRAACLDKLVNGDSALLNRKTPALANLDYRISRNTGKDGTVQHRRNDGAVNLEEDVHCTDFLDVLSLAAVKPQYLRVALVVSLNLCSEGSNIVAAGLRLTDTALNGADILVLDPDLNRVQAFRIVRADRRKNNDEKVGVRNTNAEERIRSDHERTNVKGSAGLCGDPVLIHLNDCLAGLHKIFLGNLRHAETLIGVVRTLRVLEGAEQKHSAVVRAVCLHTLEHFLAVMENHCGRLEADLTVGNDARVEPTLAGLIVHHEHMVREDGAEAERVICRRLSFGALRELILDVQHILTLLSGLFRDLKTCR